MSPNSLFHRKSQEFGVSNWVWIYFLFADKENMVKFLIETRPELINVTNNDEDTPLIYAVKTNSTFFSKNKTNYVCFFKLWLKHFVCIFSLVEKGSESLIKYLIGKGADVNVIDLLQKTPLHYAAENGIAIFW